MRSLYWLRNDLRLEDHRALRAFAEESESGIVVWCASPSFLRAKRFRKHSLLSGLSVFFEQLRKRGFQVIATREPAKKILPRIIRQHQIDAIYLTHDPGWEEQVEAQTIQTQLPSTVWKSYSDSHLFDWGLLPFDVAHTPGTFSAFRKRVEATLSPWSQVASPERAPPALVIDSTEDWGVFEPSQELDPTQLHPRIVLHEEPARARLHSYIRERRLIDRYSETRNGLIEWDDSTKLSAALSQGSLSAAQIARAILEDELERGSSKSSRALYYEILWREYFRLVLVQKGASLFRGVRYRDGSREAFERWCRAETECEFVNANMREFITTGWMSNRGRQNVASYLAKTLRVDWRWGAEFFEEHLVDYDCASNYGNWTYLAGVGNDPRDRVFSTQRQAEVYDPERKYRDLWARTRNGTREAP